MHESHEDITSRIETPPDWHDIHGCPRWGKPKYPHLMGRIRCQACGQEFTVCLATPVYMIDYNSVMARMEAVGPAGPAGERAGERVDERVTDGNIVQVGGNEYELHPYWHYGDPPHHGCIGDSMNSEPEWDWPENK